MRRVPVRYLDEIGSIPRPSREAPREEEESLRAAEPRAPEWGDEVRDEPAPPQPSEPSAESREIDSPPREEAEQRGDRPETSVVPEDMDASGDLSPEELRERWLRASAEVENLRKRFAARVEMERRGARLDSLRAWLPVIDNLERALASASAETDADAWREGMEAIRRQMLDTVSAQGARPFDPKGQPFDPERHEAIARLPGGGAPSDTVVETTLTGYEFEDGRLVRPAQVVVSAGG